MKWMDVMMGEIAAKRDAADVRDARREALLGVAEARFDAVVRPALEAFRSRLEAAGTSLTVSEFVDPERGVRVLRLEHAVDDSHPFRPYLEFAAEPYHAFVVVWLRAACQSCPTRHELFRHEELNAEAVSACLEVFEPMLTTHCD